MKERNVPATLHAAPGQSISPRAEEIHDTCADVSKTRFELGWLPKYTLRNSDCDHAKGTTVTWKPLAHHSNSLRITCVSYSNPKANEFRTHP
jgi:hypothetical protein